MSQLTPYDNQDEQEKEALKAAQAWQTAPAYGAGIGSVVGGVAGGTLGALGAAIPIAGPAIAAAGIPALAAAGSGLGGSLGGLIGKAIGDAGSQSSQDQAARLESQRTHSLDEAQAHQQALDALLGKYQHWL